MTITIGTRSPALRIEEDVKKDPVTITFGSGNKQVLDCRGVSTLIIWPGTSGTVSWSVVHAADATAHDEEQVTSEADQVVVIPVEAAFYMVEAGTADCDVHFLVGTVTRRPVEVASGSGNKRVFDTEGVGGLIVFPDSTGTISWSVVDTPDASAHGRPSSPLATVADQVVTIDAREGRYVMVEAGTAAAWVHFMEDPAPPRPREVAAGTKRVIDCHGATELHLHPDPEAGTGTIKYSVVHEPGATAHGSPATPTASSAGVVVSVTTLTGRYYLVEAATTPCWAHVLYA